MDLHLLQTIFIVLSTVFLITLLILLFLTLGFAVFLMGIYQVIRFKQIEKHTDNPDKKKKAREGINYTFLLFLCGFLLFVSLIAGSATFFLFGIIFLLLAMMVSDRYAFVTEQKPEAIIDSKEN